MESLLHPLTSWLLKWQGETTVLVFSVERTDHSVEVENKDISQFSFRTDKENKTLMIHPPKMKLSFK